MDYMFANKALVVEYFRSDEKLSAFLDLEKGFIGKLFGIF